MDDETADPVYGSAQAAGASAVNRELTALLLEAGRAQGFDVVAEYPVKGGRLDVVWTWTPAGQVPGLDAAVPVVGFEVESSWRTRKHVKGDLLNLTDAGVALGVIVLAGDTEKDTALRRFTELLVDRPGPRILVWTAADVQNLAAGASPAGVSTRAEVAATAAEPPNSRQTEDYRVPSQVALASHSGKYAPLHRWLLDHNADTVALRFDQVEDVLGFPLPSSCRNHPAHWQSYEGSAVARAIFDAGFKASQVNLTAQTVTLTRT